MFDIIAREIEEIERKWRAVLSSVAAEAMLPARWSYAGGALRWHVWIEEEVLESDIDVEITSAALVVRARPVREESRVLIGVLPVPHTFRAGEPEIRFESDTLEIVLYTIGGDNR